MRKSDLLFESSKEYRNLMDQIHESIQEETDYEMENNEVAASQAGLTTWVYLKKLMIVLDAKTLCDLEHETAYDLLYWANSLVDHLHNASIKEASFLQKKYDFCKEYIEMHQDFLDKNMRNLGNMRRAFAECYVDRGDLETCDHLFSKWLQQEPDWGWGWIGWSGSMNFPSKVPNCSN